MKKLLAMTTIIILTVVIILVYIANKPQSSTDLSVLRDITDSLISQPETREIMSRYNLTSNDKWNGVEFRFKNVSDVSYNPTSEVSLEEAHPLFSNEFTRDKQVKWFKDSVASIITQAGNDKIGKEHSLIYLPIANELIRLTKSDASKRILVIYSDLMENDLDLSLYAPNQLNLVKENGVPLKEAFEKQMTLPSLKGIDVYFIYQPTDAESNKDFGIISNFYCTMLQEKEAHVHISANLSN